MTTRFSRKCLAAPSCKCELPSGFMMPLTVLEKDNSNVTLSLLSRMGRTNVDQFSEEMISSFFKSYRYKIASSLPQNHEVHRLFANSQTYSEQGIHYKSFLKVSLRFFVSSSSSVFWNSETFLVVWMVCLFCSLICWRWMTRIILAATPRMTRMDTRLILVFSIIFHRWVSPIVIGPSLYLFEKKGSSSSSCDDLTCRSTWGQ